MKNVILFNLGVDLSRKMLYNYGMEKLIFDVADIIGEMKISDYLRKKLGFSTSLITKVKMGGVSISGTVVTMRATVKSGDIIEVILPEEESEGIKPIEIKLNIVYEDEHVLVVDKPTDMPTHPSRGNSLPTLANAVAAYMGKPFVFRSVNRLDRGTSGLVVIAKNSYSAAKLGRSMKNGEFLKKYTAHVEGVPEKQKDVISAPIRRECEGNIKRIVAPDGKEAITEYEVIEVLEDGTSLCLVTLHTGRTHQIRVHFAHIGHPLVGDFLYGKEKDRGYFLRCSEISFPHPLTNKIVTFKI